MALSAIGRLGPVLLAAAAVAAAGCGDSLVDHRASPEILAPVCEAGLFACDGRCLTCAPPVNAVAACVAGGCGFTCNPGYNSCGGPSCTREGDVSCGLACQDCTAGVPANAVGRCDAVVTHACYVECSPGFIRSGASCQAATAVSAGFFHTCALLADGAVKCWGQNARGQLGDGTTTTSAVPVAVSLPGPASAVAAGYAHTCALAGGKVWCWGNNTEGQMGNGTVTPMEPSPVEAAGLTGVLGIGAGRFGLSATPYGHTCAILSDHSLKCWGAGTAGQLGDAGTASQASPVAVTVLPAAARTQVQQVVGGQRHTCARTTSGAVYCWGANDQGQLGIGSTSPPSNPVAATIASGALAIAAGDGHGCAIVGTGALECWGLNGSGQVDAATAGTNYTSPRTPGGLGSVATQAGFLGAGRNHSCASRAADLPKCFGDDTYGQVGVLGNPSDAPIGVAAQAITGGSDHTCVLTTAGGVQCWGRNEQGQLGRGTITTSETTGAYVSGR